MSRYRGHNIELAKDEWIYSDTKEVVKDFHLARTCGNCNKPYTNEGHDMCLGTLRGVMNACCGHGSEEEAYVQFLDGFCIRGKDAKIILNILKMSNQTDRGSDKLLKNKAAERIFEKYLRRGPGGELAETIEESFDRVAMGIATYDREPTKFYPEISRIMKALEFIPNRPAWFGIGRHFGFTSACTFLNVQDSLISIMKSLSSATLIQQAGGGVGWNVSDLRPEGSLVSSTGGVASGPVRFLKSFNALLGEVQQGGLMQGANNASLYVHHPDIRKFIKAKNEDEALDQFNTNILVDDAFMVSVFDGVPESVSLMHHIVYAMWKNGGIGCQFVDTANRRNAIPDYGPLQGTNPCSEFWLFDGESCQPGYINMVKVFDAGRIAWDKLKRIVTTGVRCMDNLIDCNRYIPSVPKLKEMALATRRMGIGPNGMADLFILMGLRYDGPEALDLMGQIMEFILYHAMVESVRLAGERGSFPLIDQSVFSNKNFRWEQPVPAYPYEKDWNRPELNWPGLASRIKEKGIRNCGHTVIAPSSFGAQTMGTSGYGLEPVFMPEYNHNRGDGYTVRVESELATMDAFMAAHEVRPIDHVWMVAAAIPFVTESISKTVNMSFEATEQDVNDVVVQSWRLGLKNVIVYRTTSRTQEVFTPCVECADIK